MHIELSKTSIVLADFTVYGKESRFQGKDSYDYVFQYTLCLFGMVMFDLSFLSTFQKDSLIQIFLFWRLHFIVGSIAFFKIS